MNNKIQQKQNHVEKFVIEKISDFSKKLFSKLNPLFLSIIVMVQHYVEKFIIQKISDFSKKIFSKMIFPKSNPWLFLAWVTIVADIFWIYMYDLNRFLEGAFWWSFFGFYIFLILSTYKNNLVILVKKFKNEGLIAENYQIKLFSNWWRIPAYIFWYSYFIYFSKRVFELHGYNLLDSFINFPITYKIGLLLYTFSWVAVAIPMVGDGFGIVPKVWGLSKDIFENKENPETKINLFHADKCAGFKPLGDFVFKLSLLIGLPFIIGMPIRIYELNKTGLLIFEGIINDAFSMAFLGVGFASSVLFIKSSYYIYQKIEELKAKKLDEISKELKDCYSKLDDLDKAKSNEVEFNSVLNRIHLLDNEVKKINDVKLAPWGANRIKEFYSVIFLPTTATLITTKLIKLLIQNTISQ